MKETGIELSDDALEYVAGGNYLYDLTNAF